MAATALVYNLGFSLSAFSFEAESKSLYLTQLVFLLTADIVEIFTYFKMD